MLGAGSKESTAGLRSKFLPIALRQNLLLLRLVETNLVELGCRRHSETERLGCFEVDHKFVLGRSLNRQVGRLPALKEAIDVVSRAPVQIDPIRP